GGDFLGFQVPQPRKVLYVDGEMDPAEVQDILGHIHKAAVQDGNGDPSLAATNLRILSHAVRIPGEVGHRFRNEVGH
ncbi:MAG TPA: hypothetical protein VEK82_16930, partial [Stellaceae bacterium]|nr:hypothetical protein [Stellaceae bacterium]